MPKIPLVFALLLWSCAPHRTTVIMPQPGDPDSTPGWVDLRPGMELRVEGAYYREGAARRGLTDYLGAEKAIYEVRPSGGLRLVSVSSFLEEQPGKVQPRDQPAVQLLVRPRNLSYRFHRLFFQIVVSRTGGVRPAVLLGSSSSAELDSVTARFLAGERSICGAGSSNRCTAFPALCTASLAIEIMVNGVAKKVIWGSMLGSVASNAHHIELLRVSNGAVAPIEVDAGDPEARRMPLLHGDKVTWQ